MQASVAKSHSALGVPIDHLHHTYGNTITLNHIIIREDIWVVEDQHDALMLYGADH